MKRESFGQEQFVKADAPLGLNAQRLIRFFFTGNAALTIAILALIMIFLLKEGAGFLPAYQKELNIYRKSGLELADIVNAHVLSAEKTGSLLNQALAAEIRRETGNLEEKAAALSNLQTAATTAAAAARADWENARERGATATEMDALRGKYSASVASYFASRSPAEVKGADGQALFSAEEWSLLIEDLSAPPEVESGPEASETAETGETQLPENERFTQRVYREVAEAKKEALAHHAALADVVEQYSDSVSALDDISTEMSEPAILGREEALESALADEAREKLQQAAEEARSEGEKSRLLGELDATPEIPVDLAGRREEVAAFVPEAIARILAHAELSKNLTLPEAVAPAAAEFLKKAALRLAGAEKEAQETDRRLTQWSAGREVGAFETLIAFLFGKTWTTNTSRMDFYGVLPLVSGSFVIALIAMALAAPFSVAAAVYTNQIASPLEKEAIKPVIEIIQAIPSVVFGFIGIVILGEQLKVWSDSPCLSWIPGFPISERLNMFNAGCLLALMALPTMYSLAEDALQNVPRHYSEGSAALGATKLQTVFRVVLPAAGSGVLAALLLGLGRILGETMVVLLVAGNRIAIPDFSDGPAVVFQPAHTMTGLIAQELGEVSSGSTHWKALFMVGILLFAISLLINFTARRFVRLSKQGH